MEARALIYQKYLLSEDSITKLDYLFLLEELFKEGDLTNVYSKFLSDKIEEIDVENLPDDYKEAALNRIVSDEDLILVKS